jgi:FKBP-type peptidyl-prolyl cis-trans isomerase
MADEEQQTMEAEAPPPVEEPAEPLPEWGEDVTPEKDGGLFKKILQESVEEGSPMKSDEVFVHYTGRLLDGTVFDSSVERSEPFKFKLGTGAVIKGWDVGVATMRKGEKCILTCRPNYGYGETGSPPKIPGNATLQFEVELLSWKGEDISKDGGVVKSIVTEGKDYNRPSDGAKCNVHIRGTYKDRVFEERDVSFDYGEGE